MKIKEVTSQDRRDFTATLECESCGHEQVLKTGYDDAHYHKEVIPKIPCLKCGEIAPDNYRPLATKHLEGTQV